MLWCYSSMNTLVQQKYFGVIKILLCCRNTLEYRQWQSLDDLLRSKPTPYREGGGLASQGYIQAFIDIFMIHALA